MAKVLSGVIFIFLVCLFIIKIVLITIAEIQDKKRNSLKHDPSVIATQETKTFHESLFVADMHADSLLWNRDLSKRHDYGHIDLPRLQSGNIALQIFSIVSKTPRNLNLYKNKADSDNITLLGIAQGWPIKSWTSLKERALYQAQRLKHLEQKSSNQLVIISNQASLRRHLENRNEHPNSVAGLLSVEGGQVLEGDIDNLKILYDAGIRIIGFTHFFDNELGGSAHGWNKNGITQFGKQVLKDMENLQMIVDLAHASNHLFDDIVKLSTRPVIASHTGFKALCGESPRNLTDKQARDIANSQGLIGVGFWPNATCDEKIKGIVNSISYGKNLVGIDHIALGSDFDGNVQTPIAADELIKLTQALIDNGFTPSQIMKVMGNNLKNFLMINLPKS